MENIYTWRVIPSTTPSVLRNCPKCGCHSEYVSTSCFRVNANSNRIDVWLIYQCRACKSTWNLEILSRVDRNQISKDLYHRFLANDPELARQYAFDAVCHSRNKSSLSYDHVEYEVSECFIPQEILTTGFRLELLCDYSLDIRLDRLLGRQFAVSREQIKKLGKSGKIKGEGLKDIGKAKLKNGTILEFAQNSF